MWIEILLMLIKGLLSLYGRQGKYKIHLLIKSAHQQKCITQFTYRVLTISMAVFLVREF